MLELEQKHPNLDAEAFVEDFSNEEANVLTFQR
jgi:hypothetical protein